jgi:hypothetical protein
LFCKFVNSILLFINKQQTIKKIVFIVGGGSDKRGLLVLSRERKAFVSKENVLVEHYNNKY